MSSLLRPASVLALALVVSPPGAGAASPRFEDRVRAALVSFAIGDGMAAEWETWTPEQIAARFGTGDFTAFVPPLKERPADNPGKGDGRISDDTLEVEALLRAYVAHGDHLDAHAYAAVFVPELERPVWVPERAATLPAINRPLWWPERYAHHRNAINRADPRTAGVGNWLNQGLAVIIWPVGAIHAGDPDGAYAAAVAFGSAHTESYALEAAAVTAAAFAAAFAADATVESVLAAARTRARDGTRLALDAVLATVDPADDLPVFAAKARRAWLPYSGLPPARLAAAAPDTTDLAGTNVGLPSRIQSIESLPAALAALKWSGGDWHRALRAGLLYGRDAESIAAVAAALAAALHGPAAVPADLAAASAAANRRDWNAQADAFSAAVRVLAEKDAARHAARRRALATP
jgi:ADP-ribosylglycohydrolase